MSDEARVVSYRFSSAAFAGEDLPVGHVRLVEALSEPYLLRVAVASRDPDAPLESMLGKDVTLDIARHVGRTRRVCGIAREVTEGERAGLAPIAELEVVPALSYLGLRRDTRIFQDTAVPAILKKVLGDGLAPYGRRVTFDLRGTYEPREYCV